MKASIEDVARQAGVSTATVSRAFSRPDMVSAKTRAKVMEAAQQLDFSVSRMAGILKSGRSHRVALLVGAASSTGSPRASSKASTKCCDRPATIWSSNRSATRARARSSSTNCRCAATRTRSSSRRSPSPRPKSGDSTPRGSRSSASTRPRRGSPPPWASTTRPASG